MPRIEYGKKEFQQFVEKKYDTIRSKQRKIISNSGRLPFLTQAIMLFE